MLQDLALTGRLCGALLYYPPGAPEFEAVKPLFMSTEWARAWPYGSATEVSSFWGGFTQQASEPLADAYQRLFIGPGALAAPHGARYTWIKRMWCLVTRPWPCAIGWLRGASPLSIRRRSRRIILA